jgi:hypothetical protein
MRATSNSCRCAAHNFVTSGSSSLTAAARESTEGCRSPPALGAGTRESGENPELPRSGIGNEIGLEALEFQAHARERNWEAAVSR